MITMITNHYQLIILVTYKFLRAEDTKLHPSNIFHWCFGVVELQRHVELRCIVLCNVNSDDCPHTLCTAAATDAK